MQWQIINEWEKKESDCFAKLEKLLNKNNGIYHGLCKIIYNVFSPESVKAYRWIREREVYDMVSEFPKNKVSELQNVLDDQRAMWDGFKSSEGKIWLGRIQLKI